jgi:hypothetical protein
MYELILLETHVALDVLANVLPKVTGRTPVQLRGIVRRAIIRVDKNAAAKRRREARRGRRVFTSPEPDGISLFGAYLPAESAAEAYQLVDAHAATLSRDDRCADERRADALMELLRGGGAGAAAPRHPRIVDVVVPVTVALGCSDECIDLPGYGPMDAEAAKELITDALLRKICADAETGEILAVESKTYRVRTDTELRSALLTMVTTPTPYDDDAHDEYRPTAAQRRTMERRDRTCTFPSCSTPAYRCDAEHRVPHPRGPTALHNLGATSRRHHRAKQTGWTPSPTPDGSILWQSPSGRMYTRPPAHDPPQPVDPDATLPPQ